MDIQQLYDFYRRHPVLTTDSRDCPEGSIFMALKGENFDGNRFAAQALAKGCALAVVSDPQVVDDYLAHGGDTTQMVLVHDTLQTFKDLAREHRRQFAIPVIGITGTNGKTTTKELVRAVLAQRFNVMATEGNFNNDVGVPKTLLRLLPEHDIAIVEMGASHPGDIRTLAETAEPTCGLITNVGKAHLLGFGSFEGVMHTKGELYDYLASRCDGHIFVNADNDHLMRILPGTVAATCYTCSADRAACRVCGQVTASDPLLRLRWRENNQQVPGPWHEVNTQLVGAYNLDNVLAAVAVGRHFGVTPEQICRAIEQYAPSNSRSQFLVTPHNRLVVDAYNANPTSMEAAVRNFDQMTVPGAKLAIIGEMRELGGSSREEHERLLERLRNSSIDRVWLVGHEFDALPCGAFARFADVLEVKEAIAELPPRDCTILIKGSNGNRLFELPPLL
ncbi:MAG: UDP-N-acetylmuramoyl-tripeptide--D-alanyl-D-alanine ligase [Muribaculaceae bacterium]|nr:UDP-N-acetylmuramoyl-tripeptide--D-alanyl-D-alanine ligase [Muribaculaceae bacterium]